MRWRLVLASRGYSLAVNELEAGPSKQRLLSSLWMRLRLVLACRGYSLAVDEGGGVEATP
jgi:hypothetical protein